jgi:hypothetical protein
MELIAEVAPVAVRMDELPPKTAVVTRALVVNAAPAKVLVSTRVVAELVADRLEVPLLI